MDYVHSWLWLEDAGALDGGADNRLLVEGMEALSRAFRPNRADPMYKYWWSKLTKLDLGGINNIGMPGAHHMGAAVKYLTNLETIVLNRCAFFWVVRRSNQHVNVQSVHWHLFFYESNDVFGSYRRAQIKRIFRQGCRDTFCWIPRCVKYKGFTVSFLWRSNSARRSVDKASHPVSKDRVPAHIYVHCS